MPTVATAITIHIWYDEDMDAIKIRTPHGLTSVNNDPAKKQGNPSLYKKLTASLRDAGKTYPSGVL